MADRRMFSKNFTDSDGFANLSKDARLLYFYIGVHADDDGFNGQVQRLARSEGIDSAAIDELKAAGYLMQFDSGVYLLPHWNVHNTIQSDRYHETDYKTEKATIRLNKNKIWERLDTNRIQTVSKLDTQLEECSLGQVGKSSVAQSNVAQSNGKQRSTEESGETELSAHEQQNIAKRFKELCLSNAATPTPPGGEGTP